ncbi:MAG: hypothetical protein H6695_11080 [Deferribacteres bacterium]|nr:hypothetical protein [candidate division KSB1 bacterium]MCB9510719.1 hypothetical protein [Deferribacteres bacterium]
MDTFFKILIMIVIASAGGLIFRSWLERKRADRKQVAFLNDMVKKAEGKFQNNYNGTAPDTLKDAFGGGYSMFFNSFPYRIENAGEALKMYEGVMKDGVKQSVFNQKIILLSESSALVTYNWIRGGASGKTTHVWRLEHGQGWKLMHDHTSHNAGGK